MSDAMLPTRTGLKIADLKVVALAGGVGGARLADGLARVLVPENLTVIVNTGDDFEYLGLKISPDLDTACYTLSGKANPATGWGRSDESWHALETIGDLGGPTWFRLGDRDLGLHLERARLMRAGASLSQVTRQVCRAWSIRSQVLPMSDDPVPTWVYTDEGELPFQEYFVHRQCHPRVIGFRFAGVESARPAPNLLESLAQAQMIVFCPSNPWVSIDPILSVPGVRTALESARTNGRPILAVSPIIGGQAVKGPAAKMYEELGIQPSALAVARHYGALVTGFVVDNVDRALADHIRLLKIELLFTDTIMKTIEDRRRLAVEVLSFGASLI